jgi:hypothetical protein
MLLFRTATEGGNLTLTVVSGISFALAALTNAVMLPFATLLGVLLWIRGRMTARITTTFIMATFCALTPWLIRNATSPTNHLSSTSRAMENLVQGSWPEYHSAYMDWARGGGTATSKTLSEIDQEVDAMNTNSLKGAAMVLHRLMKKPPAYTGWYIMKPVLLWEWSIRIGQGDLYVYGTRNSPYENAPTWRIVQALCNALNPFLMLLAAIGCALGLRRTERSNAMAATAFLLLFITAVYSSLQAEPRYSVPYRGPEILLGIFAIYWLTKKWGLFQKQPMPNLHT